MLPAMRGSCHGVTEGACTADLQLAPSGPLGHLPRDAGEELSNPHIAEIPPSTLISAPVTNLLSSLAR